MKRQNLINICVCSLLCIAKPISAETITYNFSSPDFWVTETNGDTHPQTGINISNIYYAETNDCFVGQNDVYFHEEGGLMLKLGASLKIPYNPDWTITKITLHSHSRSATTAKVGVFSSHDGAGISNTLTWENKDADYEYNIIPSFQQSPMYIKTSSANARIASVTIDYTSSSSSFVSPPIFNPDSQTFSTESLNVTVTAAEGCEIYYTTDGTTPSYTNAEEYVGTKGNTVTIYAGNSPVTLKAIAVDPATGNSSYISSATYTYIDPSTPEEEEPEITIVNDGSKTKPYTVAEMRAMPYSTNQKDKWVKGIICGTIWDNKVKTSNFKENTNIALGDANAYASVQLPSGDIRTAINLKDHPYLQGKELLIKGDIEAYEGVLGVKAPDQYEITYDVPINQYGYASLFLDIPVSAPTGSTAYFCTIDGEIANLHAIETTVPDSTGIIISSTPNTICKLTYTTDNNVDEAIIADQNQLVGFIRDSIMIADGNAYYALNAKEGKVGFYIPQTAEDATDATKGFIAKANKAYLKVPAEHRATMFIIHRENKETRIVPTKYISKDIIYDLYGRTVTHPVSGIYIIDGKKVIIRQER